MTKVDNEEGTETTLTMRIWDAAGDNEIHNLAHLFVKDVQCGILVYAINSQLSFTQIEEWHKHLEPRKDEMILVLVGNKSDLGENRAVPQEYAI